MSCPRIGVSRFPHSDPIAMSTLPRQRSGLSYRNYACRTDGRDRALCRARHGNLNIEFSLGPSALVQAHRAPASNTLYATATLVYSANVLASSTCAQTSTSRVRRWRCAKGAEPPHSLSMMLAAKGIHQPTIYRALAHAYGPSP